MLGLKWRYTKTLALGGETATTYYVDCITTLPEPMAIPIIEFCGEKVEEELDRIGRVPPVQ